MIGRVKKFIIAFFIAISSFISAQGTDQFSPLASSFKNQYAVPDAPAFKMLNITESNILKPASVKDITLAFSEFLGKDFSISLPQSFAVEFSPALIINGKSLSLKEYSDKRFLYRLRLSLATNRNEGESTASSLAFGVRITISDNSDLRTKDGYLQSVTAVTTAIQKIIVDKKKTLGPTVSAEDIAKMPDVKQQINEYLNDFQNEWSDTSWNADISEIAFAIKTTSRDTLASNLKFSKLSSWYSSAFGIGNWGQLLLGAYGNYEKDFLLDKFLATGSLGMRFYAGTNKMKFYLETQASIIQDKNPEWLLNTGLEFKAQGNIWAEFTAGFKKGNEFKKGALVTDFKLKYGI